MVRALVRPTWPLQVPILRFAGLAHLPPPQWLAGGAYGAGCGAVPMHVDVRAKIYLIGW